MARLTVRLTPRAGADAIDSIDADGIVRARVAAPPADGRANGALVHLLAKALRVPASSVALAAGARGRTKIVDIAGIGDAEALVRLRAKVSGAAGAS